MPNTDACIRISRLYERLGDRPKQLNALLDGLCAKTPRAPVLCEIGRWYMAGGRFGRAVFWYEQALRSPAPKRPAHDDCFYGFTPHRALSVCYDHLGLSERAERHRIMAALCYGGIRQ